jgi:hypothetical protein
MPQAAASATPKGRIHDANDCNRLAAVATTNHEISQPVTVSNKALRRQLLIHGIWQERLDAETRIEPIGTNFRLLV